MGRLRQSKVGIKKFMLLCVSEINIDGIWFLDCRCDCGEMHKVKAKDFGRIKSCGCLLKLALGSTTHSLSGTVEYEAWSSMRKRCNCNWHHAYHNYGGRGIMVRERWGNLETGFLNFLKDMGKRPSSEHSLDRIDVNDDYYKENCRWADRKTQCNNRRNNIHVEIDGEINTLSEWCEIFDKSIQMVSHRVSKLKMSYEEALKTPKLRDKGKNKPKEED